MLKRLIALTLALLLTAGFALAEENLQYDGLLDKLIDQLQRSGMRGIFRLTVEGDSDLALQLRPLSGAMIQFRALTAEDGPESDHRSEFTLYAEKDGVRTADTRLWSDGESLYVSSELLIDTILRYPWKGDFVSSLTGAGQSNPNYLTAVATALIHGRDWEKYAAPLRAHAENWLMAYAGNPEQRTENGTAVLHFAYEIPEQALKDEIKTLLRLALTDENIFSRVRFYLTKEQWEIAFSENMLAYEDWFVDGLRLGGPLRIEREVNSMGAQQRLQVVFPLGEGNTLTWEQGDGADSYTLQAGEAVWGISVRQTRALKDAQAWEGTFTCPGTEGQIRANFTLERTYSEQSDTEFVDHEIPTWNLDITPAGDSDVAFEPVNLAVRAHYFSKYDQRSSTTLEFEAIWTQETTVLNLRGRLLSVKRWDVENMDVTGAVDALSMTPEQRTEILMDYLTNAMVTLSTIGTEEKQPEASEEAAAEPVEAAPVPQESEEADTSTYAETESAEEALPSLVLVDSIDLDESEEGV